MREFFAQALLFLASLVTAAIIPLLQPRVLKVTAKAFAVAGVAISLSWAGYELGVSHNRDQLQKKENLSGVEIKPSRFDGPSHGDSNDKIGSPSKNIGVQDSSAVGITEAGNVKVFAGPNSKVMINNDGHSQSIANTQGGGGVNININTQRGN